MIILITKEEASTDMEGTTIHSISYFLSISYKILPCYASHRLWMLMFSNFTLKVKIKDFAAVFGE